MKGSPFFRWNHAFKNQITTLQGQAKNRSNPNRSEVQANLSLFLEAASGFYTQVSQGDHDVETVLLLNDMKFYLLKCIGCSITVAWAVHKTKKRD